MAKVIVEAGDFIEAMSGEQQAHAEELADIDKEIASIIGELGNQDVRAIRLYGVSQRIGQLVYKMIGVEI